MTIHGDDGAEVRAALRRINETWLAGRVDDLAPLVHEKIVMILPGFAGRLHGRDTFRAGFRDFCDNARVHEYVEDEPQIDVVGNTGVATFDYRMVYERAGDKSRVNGRELWVFERSGTEWLMVWRAMLEANETAVTIG